MNKINFQKLEKLLPGLKRNVLLKNYTTFRIGGRAKYFFEARNKADLIKAILLAKKNKLPFFILGGGSNILVADKGFKGLVIKTKSQNFKVKNNEIFAEAGVLLAWLVNKATENNLTGLEWAVGIPGTLGGAIYGNAGNPKESIKDVAKEVEVFDASSSKIKYFSKEDCKFDYRDSIFKDKKNLIILSVILHLRKGNKKDIQKTIRKYWNYRRGTQPLDLPSAGSIFKNPKGYYAGELIEKCALKGNKSDGVKISEKHANFILNFKNGKAKDVKKLIKLIKQKVKNKFRISLKEEIQYLPSKF